MRPKLVVPRESNSTKFGSATVDFLIGIVFRYAAQLAVLLIIARTQGADSAGTFALALAIAAPFFVLSSLGLRTIIITYDSHFSFRTYLKICVASSASAFIVVSVIGVFVSTSLFRVLIAVAVMKFSGSVAELCFGFLQLHGRSRMVAVSSFLIFAATVGGSWSAIELSLQIGVVGGAAVGQSLAIFAWLLWRVGRLARRIDPSVRGEAEGSLRKLIWAGFVTGLSWGSATLVAVIPQYALGWFSAPAAVAKFAVALYVLTAGQMLMNGVSQAWISTARQQRKRGLLDTTAVLKYSAKITAILTPAFGGILISGFFIIPLAFGSEFRLSSISTLAMGASLLVIPTMFVSAAALVVQNSYGRTLRSSLLAAFACAIGSVTVIPVFGITGALWTNFLALLIRALGGLYFFWVADRHIDISINARHPEAGACHE